jgi:uncharacterized membrane protein
MSDDLLNRLREFADVAEAGDKPHWAQAMRDACGGLLRYGERHVKCGRAIMKLESDLAAAVARAERAEAALQRIALLDPADTDEGFNEWGEAACYVEAKDIADAALAAKETPDA